MLEPKTPELPPEYQPGPDLAFFKGCLFVLPLVPLSWLGIYLLIASWW
jgi:hypothetical protein